MIKSTSTILEKGIFDKYIKSINVYIHSIHSIYIHIYLQTQKDVDIYTIKLHKHRVILHVYAYIIILLKK